MNVSQGLFFLLFFFLLFFFWRTLLISWNTLLSLCFYVLYFITVIFLWMHSCLFMAFALIGSITRFSLYPAGWDEIQFGWLRWNNDLLFSAGCPHCKNAVPHFITAAETFKEDRKVRHNLMKKNLPLARVVSSCPYFFCQVPSSDILHL